VQTFTYTRKGIMTAPTKQLRALIYLRDNNQCVDCGTSDGLTFQHRESSGHGGRGKRAPELTAADGLTLCILCNQACEAAGQTRALELGYKIRRNRITPADLIPYFDGNRRAWFLPETDGSRTPIIEADAQTFLVAAGNLKDERRHTDE
jgi:hypothetical protein